MEDTPGVTRDRIISDASGKIIIFTLIDYGGIEPAAKVIIFIPDAVQAEVAMDMADLILLLVDGRGGMNRCR